MRCQSVQSYCKIYASQMVVLVCVCVCERERESVGDYKLKFPVYMSQ